MSIVAGMMLGDFLVAFGHWFEDNYLYYDYDAYKSIPFLNRKINEISKSNDLHHYVPRLLTQKSYFMAVQSTLLFIPIIVAVYFLLIPKNKNTIKGLLGVCLVVLFSEVSHRWQHYRECEKNAFIRLLQETLLVSSKEHKVHHGTKVTNSNYGVVSKHLNKFYDLIGVWSFLECITPLKMCKKTNQFPFKPVLEECPYKMSESDKEKYRKELHYMRSTRVIPACAT